MAIKLYNTLTRKKEIFKPLKDSKVNMFVCGITPYDYAHIGHAKTYVQFDVIAHYLKYKGYNLFYLQNITDIDDKIISKANNLKKNPLELAHMYEKYYYEDIKSLNINSVTKYARATEYISEIVSQVERLIKLGYAYKTSDGYYFNLKKFKDYGKLSKRTALDAEDAVSRIDESKEKINKGDFCLWKFYKDNEPFWETKIGKGRPGWHIEDTAITEKEFGQQYDLHGGGRDLIFPHHEAEIAQMESISGKKPFVKYWVHTGFLNIKSEKMSKSLGNFITIREVLKKYSPEVLRLFFISIHYRNPINFDEESLEQTKFGLERINNFLGKSRNSIKNVNDNPKISKLTRKLKQDFIKNMDDDFNTPKFLGFLFIFINSINKILDKGISKNDFNKIDDIIMEIDSILNIVRIEKIPKEIINLAEEREKYRREKNWKKSDEIRELIKKKGYLIDDMKEGYNIKKN